MSKFEIKKATRAGSWSRHGIIGPAGSGKSFSLLSIAAGLGGKVAAIDTERGSLNKYAGEIKDLDGNVFEWEGIELETFSPEEYIDALDYLASKGYDNVVVDSLSHAWSGKDGALEQVDKAAKRSSSGNSYTAWRDVTPQHNRLVEAMLRYPGHLGVGMRSKVEYVLQKDEQTGKLTPKKVGMAPIQREGLDYEFDIVGDMNLDHEWVISKTRYRIFDAAVIKKPSAETGAQILEYLGGKPIAIPMTKEQLLDRIKNRVADKAAFVAGVKEKYDGKLPSELDTKQLTEILEGL